MEKEVSVIFFMIPIISMLFFCFLLSKFDHLEDTTRDRFNKMEEKMRERFERTQDRVDYKIDRVVDEIRRAK